MGFSTVFRKLSIQSRWILGVGMAILAMTWMGCDGGQTVVGPASPRQAQVASTGELNREAYDAIDENQFNQTLELPQSTFAIDVDTASYSNVRRMLREGIEPAKGAVRLEELVNYFPYDYQEPDSEHPFSVSTEMAACPWNAEHQLLRVALRGKSIDMSESKPCNLVFLLDVSGSMDAPNKLPLVKSALQLLIRQLRGQDRIAIVVYAGATGLVLDSTPVSETNAIADAIEHLKSGGSTNGGAGIQLAYEVAQKNRIDGGVNRVILCTDGDFNVGVTSRSELIDLIRARAQKDIFLSVLGFGHGNLQDSTMEQLADQGNGNYAYIDSMLEARKVFAEQVGGTLITIAKDVKIQVDFNPQHISAYRLLGYENRKLENQEFRDDHKDAGEIGAGHTVTAFYELVPAGVSVPSEDVRLSEFVDHKLSAESNSPTMLTVNLRYKQPSADSSTEFQVRVAKGTIREQPSSDFQFASCVLAYGMLLRKSEYAGDANWNWVIATAEKNIGNDPNGLRSEFVYLARVASQFAK